MRCKEILVVVQALSPLERSILDVTISYANSKLISQLHNYTTSDGSSDRDASLIIYGEVPSSKFSHLKHKYVEFVFSSMRISSTTSFSSLNPNQKYIDSLNRIVTSLMLISKDKYSLAWSLFYNDDWNKIDTELVEVKLLELSYLNRSFSISSMEEDELLSINQSTLIHLDLLSIILPNELLYKILAKRMNASLSIGNDDKVEILEKIEHAIEKLEALKIREIFEGDRVKRLLYKFKLLKYGINDSLQGLDTLINEYRLFLEQLKLKYDFEVGGLYLVSALYKIRHGDFVNSELDLQIAMDQFGVNHKKYNECLYLFWLCKFHMKAWDYLSELSDNYLLGLSESKDNFSKLEYILINYYFSIKDYNQGYGALSKYNLLYLDRSGWRVGLKYMEILYLFQLKDFTLVALKIDSFRKLIATLQGFDLARAKIMVTLMRSLLHNGLDFDKTFKLKHKLLFKLIEAKGDCAWDPMGNELIRFDSWFLQYISKENLQLYNPSDNPEQSSDEN